MCSEPLWPRAGGWAERNPAATGRAKGEARLERHADWMARCESWSRARGTACVRPPRVPACHAETTSVLCERSFGTIRYQRPRRDERPSRRREKRRLTTCRPLRVGLGKWNCPNNRTGNRPGSLRRGVGPGQTANDLKPHPIRSSLQLCFLALEPVQSEAEALAKRVPNDDNLPVQV